MKPTPQGVIVVIAFAWVLCWAVPPIWADALATETEQIAKRPEPSPSTAAEGVWRKTRCTYYGVPYDDGRKRLCADGKTVYTSDGMFCATRLVPLGSVIEVRRGKTVLRLKVCDTQAKRFGHLIDLPTKTWAKLGAKYSTGVVPVEWRLVK